ncbi:MULTISPECIES: hypothetical protein [unclassified Chryseobacterium]|uniref:hypothetical protein n=1 Tax=unclassified Chryseobacterium TaxID=2593645 RepID=UPI001AE8312C|nr:MULTISPECIES: hypothetical protein [unclassified Chryseobacterium]MBP1167678.1 hypothetical protein [Chryseobacterium sp. PvR013]MDR4893018.1 hypothetical protein [Chryseobacterium sp. CFS7]
MDVNFLGLIGNVIRLIFIFKLNYKQQQEASQKDFEKEGGYSIHYNYRGIAISVIK